LVRVSRPDPHPYNIVMSSPAEPRNPFYMVLLVIGLVFIITAFAYAVVPALEDKARAAGEEPPPSPFRDALREHGWKWLLAEVAALIVAGLASMGLDRWRRYQKERLDPPTPGA
jgi:hypothetical protein